MYVPARCSVSCGIDCAVKIAGVPPPETTGTAVPSRLNSSRARSRKARVPGSRLGNGMSPSKRRPGSRMAVRASSSAASGVCTPLRPIGDAEPGEMVVDAPDVALDDVEADGHRGRIELSYTGHRME